MCRDSPAGTPLPLPLAAQSIKVKPTAAATGISAAGLASSANLHFSTTPGLPGWQQPAQPLQTSLPVGMRGPTGLPTGSQLAALSVSAVHPFLQPQLPQPAGLAKPQGLQPGPLALPLTATGLPQQSKTVQPQPAGIPALQLPASQSTTFGPLQQKGSQDTAVQPGPLLDSCHPGEAAADS